MQGMKQTTTITDKKKRFSVIYPAAGTHKEKISGRKRRKKN